MLHPVSAIERKKGGKPLFAAQTEERLASGKNCLLTHQLVDAVLDDLIVVAKLLAAVWIVAEVATDDAQSHRLNVAIEGASGSGRFRSSSRLRWLGRRRGFGSRFGRGSLVGLSCGSLGLLLLSRIGLGGGGIWRNSLGRGLRLNKLGLGGFGRCGLHDRIVTLAAAAEEEEGQEGNDNDGDDNPQPFFAAVLGL